MMETRAGVRLGGHEISWLDIYGPFLIGTLLSCYLLAVCQGVALYYLRSQRKDHRWHKAVVWTLLLLTTIDTLLLCVRLVKVSAMHPADTDYLVDLRHRPEDFLHALVTNLTATLSQAFLAFKTICFARSMCLLHGRRYRCIVWAMTAVLSLGLLASLGLGIAFPVYLSTIQSMFAIVYSESPQKVTYAHLQKAQISSFLGLDVLLMICMSLEIKFAKTGFGASNAVLSALATVIVRNGLAMTAIQAAQLILFDRLSLWGDMAPSVLGKFYTLTVLSILISPKLAHRRYLRKHDAENALPDLLASADAHSSEAGVGGAGQEGAIGGANDKETAHTLVEPSPALLRYKVTSRTPISGRSIHEGVDGLDTAPRLGYEHSESGHGGTRAVTMGSMDAPEGEGAQEQAGDGMMSFLSVIKGLDTTPTKEIDEPEIPIGAARDLHEEAKVRAGDHAGEKDEREGYPGSQGMGVGAGTATRKGSAASTISLDHVLRMSDPRGSVTDIAIVPPTI